MPLVNFSNLDYDQVKTTLKEYLQTNANFTDYDFEGSNLSTILDVLAYNTYITSYNANMVTNEVFIDSATLRENVVSLARNIGYIPRSKTAARATVSFTVDLTSVTPVPSSLTLKKGPVASTTSSFGNQSFIFSILEDITVPVYNGVASFSNINVYQGTLLSKDFTFSSADPNQKFILPNSGIDTDLITVTVKNNEQSTTGTKYAYQNSLFDLDKNSLVYFLQEVSDERYEIFFGDGIFGKSLTGGNFITAEYIVCNGDSANGVSGFSFSGKLSYNRNNLNYSVTVSYTHLPLPTTPYV